MIIRLNEENSSYIELLLEPGGNNMLIPPSANIKDSVRLSSFAKIVKRVL
jgi:hypothetical protein